MTILLLKKNTTADTIPPKQLAQSPKTHLVARWLKDENSQLYCQWTLE